MSSCTIITRVKDLPKTLDIMEYLVVVKKNNRFYRGFLFQGYSGHAMHDEVADYRRQYPEREGYTVSW